MILVDGDLSSKSLFWKLSRHVPLFMILILLLNSQYVTFILAYLYLKLLHEIGPAFHEHYECLLNYLNKSYQSLVEKPGDEAAIFRYPDISDFRQSPLAINISP